MLLMTMCAVNTLHNYPLQFYPKISFIVLASGLWDSNTHWGAEACMHTEAYATREGKR